MLGHARPWIVALLLVACGGTRPTPTAPVARATVTPPAPVTEPTPPVVEPSPPVVEPAPTVVEPTVTQPSQPVVEPSPVTPGSFRGLDEDALVRAMSTRPVVRVIERFSSSTLVFHLDLGDGLEVAFKPDRVGERRWWRHEVMGYRLARLLGLSARVPPATVRSLPVGVFSGFDRGARFVVDRGRVSGAVIFWMPVLRPSGLATRESRSAWFRYLAPGVPLPEAPAERERTRQLAAMIAFDWLQANHDRWNGSNLREDEHGDLVYRDNNRGWFMVNLRRPRYLTGVRRVPRGLFEAAQRADGDALRAELSRDPAGPRAVVDPARLRAYETRRRAFVARVRALIARHGEADVLAWP